MEFKEYITLLADISAILTAIIALIVSIKALQSQNRHNVLSSMPVCEIFTGNFDNELVVEIYNKGLGLMEINDIMFTNSKGVTHNNLHEFILDEQSISYNTLPPRKVLMSGEKVVLVSFKDIPYVQQTKIVNILSNITVHISYRDIYNNIYTFDYLIDFV